LARVERDESGKIIKVIHAHTKKANPLNDPLNELENEEEDADGDNAIGGFEGFEDEKNEVVRQLEEQALRVAEKKPRKQSTREKEWCQRLAEKWGTDYKSMVKDRRLNPMQQNEPDIRRRIEKWRASAE
jgi:nucleolar protein 16